MEQETLVFEVVTAFINEQDESEKKFVVYVLQVRHVNNKEDSPVASIERRYTQFLNLYTSLNEEFPELMVGISFPRKALIGNFDNKLIMARSEAFESLLKHVISLDKLKESKALLNFLQECEMIKAKQLISNQDYLNALPILENNLKLLNNVYTDRSPPVLLALCRLLGCCFLVPWYSHAEKWADMALHRFEAVSDSDLLVLYIPLLQLCSKVWSKNGRDSSNLEQRLADFKRQGVNCSSNLTLLEAVTKVEMKLMDSGE